MFLISNIFALVTIVETIARKTLLCHNVYRTTKFLEIAVFLRHGVIVPSIEEMVNVRQEVFVLGLLVEVDEEMGF